MTYKFGDIVRTFTTKERGEIEGPITFVQMSGKGDPYYHVRDDDGVYWHRSMQNLTMVRPS